MPDSLRPRIIPLWPDGSPHNGDGGAGRPRLEFYAPVAPFRNASQDGAPVTTEPWPAVIVCPGGGYTFLAPHEAAPVAWMFARHGIAAFVCHYRVAPHRYPAAYADVARAVRLVRAMSRGLGIDPARLGLMGFSAGGHAAVTVATRPDLYHDPDDDLTGKLSARPNRTILAYPVVSMIAQPHEGCLTNLLGSAPAAALCHDLSADLWVDAYTPPTFIFHTADDPAVPVGHSLRYATACDAHSVPFELHIYAHGHHGVGLAQDIPALANWPQVLLVWIISRPANEGV